MFRLPAALALLIAGLVSVPPAYAETDLEQGAKAYYFCYNCHSLEPGVHLTGPSLAGRWGRKAGSAEGFGRYSEAMRSADLVWDAATLDAWFKAPQELVPGNTMIFQPIEHGRVRGSLVAFLELAMGPDGLAEVVARGLLSEDYARGRVPEVLKGAGAERQVTAIRHCGDAYWVTMADGTQSQYWERNLHFKTDASVRGPEAGQPVLVQIGSVGDRASIVFADRAELTAALEESC